MTCLDDLLDAVTACRGLAAADLDLLAVVAAHHFDVGGRAVVAVGGIGGGGIGGVGVLVGLLGGVEFCQHGLAVSDRDLVIVGVNFAKGQKTVAIAAIFDERRL